MRLVTLIAEAFFRLRPNRGNGTEPLPGQSQPQQQSRPAPKPAVQQTQDAQQLADQLLGRMKPLWLQRHGLDMEVRFKMGRMLFGGLYPSGQERLPYGGQVMKQVSKGLGISPPDLHRMVKFAREFKDLATFQAQHPGVTSWDGVKKVLATMNPAKAGPSKRSPQDPTKTIWKQIDKTLTALKTHLSSVPQGTKREDAEKRQSEFEAVKEKFNTLLSTGTTVTSVS